ncbi:PspC domain-containing protein [Micromonospora eburnea]|nr:PspC domain-containing protein [Micromonospora eburnea]
MRLAGHAQLFTLTDDAHSDLVSYLSRSRAALENEPDGDETLRDVEAALGDQLAPLCEGGSVVDAVQMQNLLDRTGSIESSRTMQNGSAPQRLPSWVRVTEGKWLAGVCLGVAARANLDPAWVRGVAAVAVFLVAGILAPLGEGIPMLLFLAAAALGYIVLIVALPPVRSVAEYRRLHRLGRNYP